MEKDTKRCLTILGYASLFCALFFIPNADAKSESSKTGPKISYRVTLHSPSANQISVQGEISPQESSKMVFERWSTTLELQELQVYDPAGQRLNALIQKDRIILPTPKGEPVTFRYWVKTGPLGRHGHQGYLGKEFGIFNGSQLFLIPSLKKGYPEVTVTFELPKGWDVVTSWKSQGGVFYPWESQKLWPNSFAKSVLAFGPFETRQEKIGETLLLISLPTVWSSSERETIFNNVSKIYHYFYGLFGASAGKTYHVVLTPNAEDSEKINADHWAFGVGTSVRFDVQRDWELLAHRIFHKFNSDPPLGMKYKHLRDGWFWEGPTSFYEQFALFESGMTLDPSWKLESPREYYSIAQCAGRYLWNYFVEPQISRLPLSEDYRVLEDIPRRDFLHYTQANLVAALLDHEMRQATGGQKSLKDLLAYQYGHYREEKGRYDLLRDLKEVTGHDFSPFFKEYIFSTKLLPIWHLGEEYPWGDEKVGLFTDARVFFEEGDSALIDQRVEKESISLPISKEQEEGLHQLKGVPLWTVKAIKRTLLQLNVTGIKKDDPHKEQKLLSPENLKRWHQYLEAHKKDSGPKK